MTTRSARAFTADLLDGSLRRRGEDHLWVTSVFLECIRRPQNGPKAASGGINNIIFTDASLQNTALLDSCNAFNGNFVRKTCKVNTSDNLAVSGMRDYVLSAGFERLKLFFTRNILIQCS